MLCCGIGDVTTPHRTHSRRAQYQPRVPQREQFLFVAKTYGMAAFPRGSRPRNLSDTLTSVVAIAGLGQVY